MKKGFNILMILCAVVFVLSCNKNKSYTEMLKDERKAIDRLIEAEGFHITEDYPANGVFGEKEFVKLRSGLYLHVSDSGNGNRAVSGTKVLTRFRGKFFLEDTVPFDLFDPLVSAQPIEFTYGVYPSSNDFISVGFISALEYVGDSSVVSMIVPFRIGSSTQSSNGYPIYFDRVRFIFEK